MPPSTTTKTVVIRVDAGASQTQLKAVADGMKQINQNTKQMASNLGLLTGAFSGFIGFHTIRQIVSMSDAMQNLNNRLILLTGTQEAASVAMRQLLALSDRTNTSVSELAQTYVRVGVSLQNLGANSTQIIALVEVLTNSFRIAGSTGEETAATIVQLSQAFSSGTLRGQELRSVMLQNATVAGLLREKFGKNLLADAEKGLIRASDVLEILYENQEKINKSAEKLTPTFGQSLTKAVGQLTYRFGELNREYGASILFGETMSKVVKNMGAIMLGVATVAVPALTIALVRLSLSNPYLAALTLAVAGLVTAINYMGDASDSFTQKLYKIQAAFYDLASTLVKARVSMREFADEYFNWLMKREQRQDYRNETAELDGLRIKFDQLAAAARKNSVELPVDPEANSKDALKQLLDKAKAQDALSAKELKAKDLLAELNQEYLYGTLVLSDYNDRLAEIELKKLNQEFVTGKKDLDAYTASLDALERKDLSKQLTAGTISLKEFNEQVEATKIETLNAKLAEGSISLSQYNEELTKISNKLGPGGLLAVGAQSYLDSLGTTSSQIADAIKGSFVTLETSFLGFIKTGKFEFAKFTEAILDDLLKIVIRASILQPIAGGLTGLFTTAPTGAAGGAYTNFPTPLESAKGNAFSGGNVIPFARGGVVSSPTMFGYGSGKNGIMGEAGPEAVLPLARGKGGNLGVQAVVTPVTINIVNNTPAEVQSVETTGPNGERQIEVLINQRVKEGIASGAYDKSFQSSYGLKRRGS